MTIANIVVKKADGSTDITYTAVAPSAGDKQPAVWRSNSVGWAIGFRPEFRMAARANGTGTHRVLEMRFSYPTTVTSTDTGKTEVLNRGNWTLSCSVPVDMPDAALAEFANQSMHVLNNAQVIAAIIAGYATT